MSVKDFLKKAFISPLQEFIHDSRAVGITLLVCTIISIIIANLNWGHNYIDFWNTGFHFPGWLHLPHTLLHWINDVLMAVFFFLVGMEIKRELLCGELSSFKKAILPITAALGGMLVPAMIFTLFNSGTEYSQGWGIPMATDIAFSLGVASLLGPRVPVSLKIFLMALAIIDDLGAIVVIALFYGEQINWIYLALGAGVCVIAGLLFHFKKMSGWWILILGIFLWYFIFNSGIHATIAGVVLAMFVPVGKLDDYEHKIHDVVNFIILPVFALANTAIVIPGNPGEALTTPLSWGVMLGLLIGKPLGITLFSWLTVKFKWGEQPSGSSWLQLFGVGILAGIGFTMSIFITMLAFSSTINQDISKIAILLASLLAVAFSLLVLRYASGKQQHAPDQV